ncbi:hypothetical protein K438DRAFT_2068061 [Mycena galopus ATCC 62051]|nr:hypothetical protein K438DRAFT_2068061 [Mycena galopus ATCC 62051]
MKQNVGWDASQVQSSTAAMDRDRASVRGRVAYCDTFVPCSERAEISGPQWGHRRNRNPLLPSGLSFSPTIPVTLASREIKDSDGHLNVIRYYYQEAHFNFNYLALSRNAR